MNQQVFDLYDYLETNKLLSDGIDRNELLFDFEILMIAKENKVKDIKGIVCEYYGFTENEINSKTRKREIVQARQIAMYFIHRCTKLSLEMIGMMFKSGKHVFDHATVLNAIKIVNDLNDVDKSFQIEFKEIEVKVLINHTPKLES